jgi:hypothetical protein
MLDHMIPVRADLFRVVLRGQSRLLPTSRLLVTYLPDGIDPALPTTVPVGKPDKAGRRTRPAPGKSRRSGPTRQDTGRTQ